ncbi:unnamed protein product [Owenia fusiformis]|uniref:Uncharacterized protein n=1 Tax=Owenia fusiformis TaxID=6347 RepID=A0A8J1Y8S1_OWEFU|nr:unnamed protein product [Owenia fusiformis]
MSTKQKLCLVVMGLAVSVLMSNFLLQKQKALDFVDNNIRKRAYTTTRKTALQSIVNKEMQQNKSAMFIDRAKMIGNKTKEGIVAVTMVNEAYLEMTYSWLCNTVNMHVHEQVLIVATDETTLGKLQHDWPNVTSVLHSLSTTKVEYREAGYIRYMLTRALLVLSILENNVTILLFEVDAIWFSSPFPLLQSLLKYDIVGAQISKYHQIAGGFLLLKPAKATQIVFTKVIDKLNGFLETYSNVKDDKKLPDGENDQTYLHEAIMSQQNLKYKLLDFNIIEDGLWYSRSHNDSTETRPLVLNNNWVIGNDAKVERAKKFGHWFLHGNNSCDFENVQKMTRD